MNFYFCANYSCALKINGEYVKLLTEELAPIVLNELNAFLEVCTINEFGTNFNYILDDEFLKNPPKNVIVVDLKNGYVIKFIKKETFNNFRVLDQQNFNYALATLYTDTLLKLSIETNSDFYIEDINFAPTTSRIDYFVMNNNKFILLHLTGSSQLLNIYHLTDKIKKVFSMAIDDYSINEALEISINYIDVLKHSVKYFFEFKNDCFTLIKQEVIRKSGLNTFNNDLLKFMFFEELLVGGNLKEFALNNIIDNKENLISYLGNYIGVIPPPASLNKNGVGLVYKNKFNRYTVKYFDVEIKENKVFNIFECE